MGHPSGNAPAVLAMSDLAHLSASARARFRAWLEPCLAGTPIAFDHVLSVILVDREDEVRRVSLDWFDPAAQRYRISTVLAPWPPPVWRRGPGGKPDDAGDDEP